AEADLDAAGAHHLPERVHLAAVKDEIALVLGELLLEAGDVRGGADDAALRPLAEHAAQAVDRGLERVDLELEPLQRLRPAVPLLLRLVLALLEVRVVDGDQREALLERAPLGAPAADVTGEGAVVHVVHALAEGEAREADAVQEGE